MASTHNSIRQMVSPLLQRFQSLSFNAQNTSKASLRPFSTTPNLLAKPERKRTGDPRITLIRYHLQHPATPRPLKFSRMRALRHWTIHRAWQLFRRKKLGAEELELQRMYQSMHETMEVLRTMDAPGTKDAGRLYRVALEKKGIFGKGGVPVEYARLQTDTPGKEAWDHSWTR
jgi:large subunit ribosomal protein L40